LFRSIVKKDYTPAHIYSNVGIDSRASGRRLTWILNLASVSKSRRVNVTSSGHHGGVQRIYEVAEAI